MTEPVPWGLGEYSTEKETPLRSWFTGNWKRKLTIKVVSDGDLFGGKNAMLEIRRAGRVVHVPVAEALAAGMPQQAIPRELRQRVEHSHECQGYWCQIVFPVSLRGQIPCSEKTCLGTDDLLHDDHPICTLCKARQAIEDAECELRQAEHHYQPKLGETLDPGEIPRLKRKLARAKQQYEKVRTSL